MLLDVLVEMGERVARDDLGDIKVVALECERWFIVDDARFFMDIVEAERSVFGLSDHGKRDAEGNEKIVLFVQRLPLIGCSGVLVISFLSAEVAPGFVVFFAAWVDREGISIRVDRADDAFRFFPTVKAEERFLAGDLVADVRKGIGAGSADACRHESNGDRADDKAPPDLADGFILALPIKKDVKVIKDRGRFSDCEYRPVSEWRYCISAEALENARITVCDDSISAEADAYRELSWTDDGTSCSEVPSSPVKGSKETIHLIPYGMTDLRIAVFPEVGG